MKNNLTINIDKLPIDTIKQIEELIWAEVAKRGIHWKALQRESDRIGRWVFRRERQGAKPAFKLNLPVLRLCLRPEGSNARF